AKWVAGVHPRRELPRFAPVTFRTWWRARPPRNEGMPRVILWPDTFNDDSEPAVLVAAVEVLEAAGHQVVLPRRWLCCGQPLYDYGMLPRARRMLARVLDTLGPALRAGVPVVGLEPSCLAVFHDELRNFFPDDPDATRLREQSYTLGEFLLH